MKNQNIADYLAGKDPVLKQVIVQTTEFDADFEERGQVDGFETLARSIISQQLSTTAARSIRGRVEDLAGKAGLKPEAVPVAITKQDPANREPVSLSSQSGEGPQPGRRGAT